MTESRETSTLADLPAQTLCLFDGQVRAFRLPRCVDPRGVLSPIHLSQLAFRPARVFLIDAVPVDTVRGGHAHRSARQLLVRIAGLIRIDLRWQGEQASLLLDAAQDALLLEPMVWSCQTYVVPDSRLLGFCDEDYDPASYLDEPT